MNLKRFFPLFNILFFCGCSSLLNPNYKRNGDVSEQRKSPGFLESLFQDEPNVENNRENYSNRNVISQNGIANPNKRPNFGNYNLNYQQPIQNPFTLSHIEGNTWRTQAHPALVFGIMSRILSQNYIISSMDRKNFNLQTDWDKFFIDGRLFRNRINIMVFPVSPRQTEVVLKNIVEYYTGSPNNKMEDHSSWLPSPDLTDEVNKLIDSTNRQTTLLQNQIYSR